MDSEGNICGVGKLEEYPKLYLRNFVFPLNSVCVKKCPSFDYNQLMEKEVNVILNYENFRLENVILFENPFQKSDSNFFKNLIIS